MLYAVRLSLHMKMSVWCITSGGVQLLEVKQEGFTCLAEPVEHDNFVTAISVNADCSKASSASQDKR